MYKTKKLNRILFFTVVILIASIAIGLDAKPISEQLTDYVKYLASDELEGRRTGTEGCEKAASYIAEHFKKIGLKASGDNNTFLQNFKLGKRETASTSSNVIGFLEGSDLELKNEVVVIGAHYDHVGKNRFGILGEEGEIHNGADDNASGTACVLELARLFSEMKDKPKRSLLFIAFSGEEIGLLGSGYYTRHPVIPIEKTVAMVNIDMVGRMKKNKITIFGVESSPDFKSLIEDVDKNSDLQVNLVDAIGPGDGLYFINEKVPSLHLFTGIHRDYHQPTDDWDKLNYSGMEETVNFTFNLVLKLANNSKQLAFAEPSGMGYFQNMPPVLLGISPILEEEIMGVKIRQVLPDTPAEEAGLKEGDIILEFDNKLIEDFEGLLECLQKKKPEDKVTIKIKRENEIINATVKLVKRVI